MLTPVQWHTRFLQQARWTQPVRRFLFDQLHLSQARRALEVGVGTGAVTADLLENSTTMIHGLDLRRDFLNIAGAHHSKLALVEADAFHLPYTSASFDYALCHYFLLWISHPAEVLDEIRRVTQPGGVILALAEPDYGGRIDFPTNLTPMGQLQAQSLRAQGADPTLGRQLAGLFRSAGLVNVVSGVLGGQWGVPPSQEELASEWSILAEDLQDRIAPADLKKYIKSDAAAWRSGERILYIPTFFAWGYVP